MFHPTHKMTPQMPEASGELSDLALDVYRKSASLGGAVASDHSQGAGRVFTADKQLLFEPN